MNKGERVKIFLIVATVVLFYGTFATWFQDTTLAGSYGAMFGKSNVGWFGWFGYVDLILLWGFLLTLYLSPRLRKTLDFYLGWMLFVIATVMLQALLLPASEAGFVGTTVTAFLQPYIGKGGVWFFWVMVVALTASLLWDGKEPLWRSMRLSLPKKPQRHTVSFDELEAERDAMRRKKEEMKQTLQRLKKNPFSSPDLQSELPGYDTPQPSSRRNVSKKSDAVSTKERVAAMPEKKQRVKPDASRKSATKAAASTSKKQEQTTKASRVNDAKAAELPWEEEATPSDKPTDVTTSVFETSTKETSSSRTDSDTSHAAASKSQVPIVNELEENARLMASIEQGKSEQPVNFTLPKLDFLQRPPKKKRRIDEAEIDRKSGLLLEKLKLFNINGDIVRTYTGPLVTTFEFKPAPNVKVSKILNLQDDLAMALSAETIRIQAPIPGRDVVGIEIPNDEREIIYLREILESDIFQNAKSPLTIALGKDIVGKPFITDIKTLPHLLIAGTTGSGKSVGINAMILSLLYKNDPDHLKLMMIDPKMLEFSIYDDIPHLITPVITEPKQAIAALANMVGEMERRYKLMAKMRTKTIDNYNEKVKRTGEGEPMPFIVVIIDELADLMMNGGKEVETSIARLAQKSRACGIHLIVATQRPSVDVVTGIIKANLPSRLSYRVGQKIDSKVILDSLGAESLLGRGDGLFTPPGTNGLVRIHAPWATEEEIETIVEFIKAQRAPEYDESYLIEGGGVSGNAKGEEGIDLDPLYEDAKQVVLNDKKTSISYLQRKLQIGYNRAANLIEQLEATGVLSAPNAKGNREILL